MDFSTIPVTVTQAQGKVHAHVLSPDQDSQKFSALWESEVALKRKWCPVAGIDMAEVMIEDCTVPQNGEKVDYEFPKDVKTCFVDTMQKFKDQTWTTVTSHHRTSSLCTTSQDPSHFRDEVEVQIRQLHNGIIVEICSHQHCTCTCQRSQGT